jgi:hypothetical protein
MSTLGRDEKCDNMKVEKGDRKERANNKRRKKECTGRGGWVVGGSPGIMFFRVVNCDFSLKVYCIKYI